MDCRRKEDTGSSAVLVDAFTDLRSTLDACGVPILTWTSSDRVALANEPFLRSFGLESQDTTGGYGAELRGRLARRFSDPLRFESFLSEVQGSDRSAREAFDTVDGRCLEVRAQPWVRHGILRGTVFAFVDVTEHQQQQELLKNSEARLWELATQDGLTGLSNRRYVLERLEHEVRRAHRLGDALVVGMLDLDHFKRVNDRLGHAEGDRVLRRFADGLRRRLRESDVVGRYGGEEFVCGLVGVDMEHAIGVLEEVRRATKRMGQGRWNVSLSIGAARFPEDGTDVSALVDVADRRLYIAKRTGRDRLVFRDDGDGFLSPNLAPKVCSGRPDSA